VHPERLGRHEAFDAFVAENPLHLIRNVPILMAEKLRPLLDDRRAAAEATVRLGKFQTDIAATEDDEMRRHVIEFQRLDVGQRAAARRPGMSGIVTRVPTLRKIRSPVTVRVPPSLRRTSSVFGATRRPAPMMSSTPLSL
jgi:hypothetical protein